MFLIQGKEVAGLMTSLQRGRARRVTSACEYRHQMMSTTEIKEYLNLVTGSFRSGSAIIVVEGYLV